MGKVGGSKSVAASEQWTHEVSISLEKRGFFERDGREALLVELSCLSSIVIRHCVLDTHHSELDRGEHRTSEVDRLSNVLFLSLSSLFLSSSTLAT